jgi:hypothetical protein
MSGCLHAIFADHSNRVIREREVIGCLLATNPRRKKITQIQPFSQGSRKKKILKVCSECLSFIYTSFCSLERERQIEREGWKEGKGRERGRERGDKSVFHRF